jgi:uncharacterized protein (DUF302 family)
MIRTTVTAVAAACLLWLLPSGALANDELITIPSAHSARVTVQRLELAIITNGWTILANVDHAFHAAQYGVKIPARTTIAFAFMTRWTKHLIENPTVAIEMPITVLVWEDGEGVWVTRNTIRYYHRQILGRHEAKVLPGPDKARDDLLAAIIDNATR